jgi:hypothetical protein
MGERRGLYPPGQARRLVGPQARWTSGSLDLIFLGALIILHHFARVVFFCIRKTENGL